MHDRTIRWGSRPVRALGLSLVVSLAMAGGALLGCEAPAHDDWPAPAVAGSAESSGSSGQSGVSRPASRPRRTAASRGPAFQRTPEAQRVALAPEHTGPDALKLFVKNCAACHGLDGSGQGPSVLDRPARNFKDGGFSFGNTADAIFNTISYGIPGTPMPAFGDSLGERERRQLAAYVRTLCPSVADVAAADTIMTVTEESGPLIVRGILPPIVDGAPLRPRGLLLGLPGGLSFEYRIDDVRLLGVRQGNFVERTDWNGRGGTPLRPLGGLVWTDADGDPPAMFWLEDGSPVARQLSATFDNGVESRLVNGDGMILADLEEKLYPSQRGGLSGFAQSMGLSPQRQRFDFTLSLRIGVPVDAERVASVEPLVRREGESSEPSATWQVFRRPDGVFEYVGILIAEGQLDQPPELSTSPEGIVARFSVPHASDSPPNFANGMRLVVHRLFATEWNETVRAQLLEQDH